MVKQTMDLRKRVIPQVSNLPNMSSFTTKWERISKKQLPINIRVRRNRTICPRRNNRMIYINLAKGGLKKIRAKRKAAQSGKGIRSSLAKALEK